MPINTAVIYAELKKINARTESMSFPEIPTPSFLQGLLFDCEMHTGKVERFYIDVTEELDCKERLLRNSKTTIEIKKRQALISNDSVKKMPTGKEREAAVDDLLEQDYKDLLSLENEVGSLNHLDTIIRHVQSNLNRTNGNVRMLAKLMEQQINRLNVGLPNDPETRDLLSGLDEAAKLENEMGLDDVESVTEKVMPIESDGGAEATSALEAPTPTDSAIQSSEDIDVAELFMTEDPTEESIEESPAVEQAVTPPEKAQESPKEKPVKKADDSVSGTFDGGGIDIDSIDVDILEHPAPVKEKPKSEAPLPPPPKTPPKEEKPAPKPAKAEPKKVADTDFDLEDILGSIK